MQCRNYFEDLQLLPQKISLSQKKFWLTDNNFIPFYNNTHWASKEYDIFIHELQYRNKTIADIDCKLVTDNYIPNNYKKFQQIIRNILDQKNVKQSKNNIKTVYKQLLNSDEKFKQAVNNMNEKNKNYIIGKLMEKIKDIKEVTNFLKTI